MKTITVRLSDDVAVALTDRKKRTLVPTEAFVRRAIDAALGRPITDDEPEEQNEPVDTKAAWPVAVENRIQDVSGNRAEPVHVPKAHPLEYRAPVRSQILTSPTAPRVVGKVSE